MLDKFFQLKDTLHLCLLQKVFLKILTKSLFFQGVSSCFQAVYKVLQVLCITLFFTVATACLRNICTALGDIKGNSIATLAQSLLFIPLVIFGTKYFGLIGAVLAPLISTLAVSVWYYPKSFSKLLNLSFKDYKSYLFETILPLVAMLVLAFGFSLFQINDWLRFFFFLFLFYTLFVCFLYLASKNFRKEINEIINLMRINFRN